jgi:hypothetical protein
LVTRIASHNTVGRARKGAAFFPKAFVAFSNGAGHIWPAKSVSIENVKIQGLFPTAMPSRRGIPQKHMANQATFNQNWPNTQFLGVEHPWNIRSYSEPISRLNH